MDFWSWVILIDVCVRLIGLLFAADAIMYARTATGSLAWAMALILLPEIAIPPYLIFGVRRFEGYVKARRRGRSGIHKVATQLLDAMKPWAAARDTLHESFAALERLTSLPATAGNRPTLLVDGEATFAAILKSIQAAKHYVLAEYYIIREDGVGRKFMDALMDASARGVKVYLLYAGGGSLGPPRGAIRKMRKAKVNVVPFASRRVLTAWLTLFTPWRRMQLNFRNHRKIVVCDGRVALLGGLNVGDEYLGLDPHPRLRPWRDTHLRLAGPCVHAVQLAWLEDWYCATGWVPELDWAPSRTAADAEHEGSGGARGESGATVSIVPSGPADQLETCGLMFHELIMRAKTRLWVSTPYFVPDDAIVQALQLAAQRGVDVRVIMPGHYDLALPYLSSFTFYEELIPSGVKLFRFMRGFNHQKTLLSDGVAAVGSANVDNRSARINFEVTAVMDHGPMTKAMEAMFENDFQGCVEVDRHDFMRRSWSFRLLCSCARLLAPIQ